MDEKMKIILAVVKIVLDATEAIFGAVTGGGDGKDA